jgi:hypothetical protein
MKTSPGPRAGGAPSPVAPPPPAGAPVAELISWIEAGVPAPAAIYHFATRDDGTTAPLEVADDVAFNTPSNKITCMTEARYNSVLQCMVALINPPPEPAGVQGEWINGWVSFDGASIEVGSLHGDPGPFMQGRGRTLPYGQVLSFGTVHCRADPAGLFCVDDAHHTGARYSDAGIEPFGCLHPVPALAGPDQDPVGEKFSC